MLLSARRLRVCIALLGLLAATTAWGLPKVVAAPPPASSLRMEDIDPRYKALENFFQKYKCPEPHYVKEYIEAADKYHLSYELLPAISLKESTCGKHSPGLMVDGKYINGACNNWWGWLIYGDHRKCFDSIPAGIDEILDNFANNPKWQGTTDGILWKYNGTVERGYPARVKSLMEQI